MIQEKIWVVVAQNGAEITESYVFDSLADAENFAEEVKTVQPAEYTIISSVLNRRETESESHLVDLPDFNTECIECLIEEIDAEAAKQLDAEACAKFFEENKCELQKGADELVQDYLRKRLADFIHNERVILG